VPRVETIAGELGPLDNREVRVVRSQHDLDRISDAIPS
jgi:hypothetical protein